MFTSVLRDRGLVDALQPTIVPFQDYLAEAAGILAAGRPTRGRRRRVLAAAVRHALGFHTWRSLAADGHITRAEAVHLATALVQATALHNVARLSENSKRRRNRPMKRVRQIAIR